LIFSDFAEVEKHITEEKIIYSTPEELSCQTLFVKIETPLQMADYLLNIVKSIGVELKELPENFASKNLSNEAVFRLYQIINRLKDLIIGGYLDLKLPTFISLIKRLLTQETVPFHGEPAQGLQLMGMLETRNLDFKNLLIFSLNEGVMPKSEPSASFIPLFIRKHFKMSSIEEQDAVFAHCFYRLLQRAENITLAYNTAQNATSKSEMSRFLLQLLTEYKQPIKRISLQNNSQPTENQPLEIVKTPELLAKIHSIFDAKNANSKTLSPSAINAFIDCSLQFYLRYVAKFKEEDEISDELGNNILGSVVHKTIELIYRQIGDLQPLIVKKENKKDDIFKPFFVRKEQIDYFLKDKKLIDDFLEMAFEIEFFNHKTSKENYTGEQKIYFDVAKKFVVNLLKFDSQNTPFQILGMESYKEILLDLGDALQVKIGGIVDSIRLKDNDLMIIDYKTSSKEQKSPDIVTLFDNTKSDRAKYILQAFFYSLILEKEFCSYNILPLLLYLPKMGNLENFSEFIKLFGEEVKDFKPFSEEFGSVLKEKLKELFDEETSFKAHFNEQKCVYCEFLNICG
jgi:CRISPR/Cas system-associated exonuclease Cas4 (RecB family)